MRFLLRSGGQKMEAEKQKAESKLQTSDCGLMTSEFYPLKALSWPIATIIPKNLTIPVYLTNGVFSLINRFFRHLIIRNT